MKNLLVTILLLSACYLRADAQSCSGTPAGGTVSTTARSVCNTGTFTLSLSGASTGTGISYQWQSSADNSTWSNIGSATAATYTTSEAAATYYRCVITCSVSGLSANAISNYVAWQSACVCSPTYTGTASTRAMNRVRLLAAGDSINDNFTPSASGYFDRTTVNFATLNKGTTYNATVSYNTADVNYENQIWIDFNDNGTYETSEAVTGVTGNGQCATSVSNDVLTVKIPLEANAGLHRMRVRCAFSNSTCYNSSQMSPCSNADASKAYQYGSTADYIVKISAPSACSGTPATGTTISDIATACSSSTFTLNLTGISASGITFQWQSSADNASWSNISGATNASLSTTESSGTWYRCTVTCTSSGSSSSSTGKFIPYTGTCYCTPTYYNNTTYGSVSYTNSMNRVSITGYSGSTLTDRFAPAIAGYLDRSLVASALTLAQGGTYSGTFYYVNTLGYYEDQIWIDFNDDGTFAASEAVTAVIGNGSCVTTVNNDIFQLTIPNSAPAGPHKMRVRNAYTNSSCYKSTAMYPCGQSDLSKSYLLGSTVDYLVNITGPTTCSGTPAAGTASATSATVCTGSSVSLVLTGASATGVTYQWQASADSSTWSDISGATTATYSLAPTASKYYQCLVSCTASGTIAASQAVYIPFTSGCYCTPGYQYYISYGTPASNNAMNKVVLNGYMGSTINDAFAPSSAGYLDRSASVSPLTLTRGGSYSGTISYVNASSYYENQIWIDYNDDGTFAASEAATIVAGLGSCATTTTADTFGVTISVSAPYGLHRMRVRNAWSNNSCYNSTAMAPCGQSDASKSYIYGATVDYMVNIVAPPPCSGTPVAGIATSGTATACTGSSFTLSLSGSSSSGLAYQWQTSSDSVSWTNISGATTATWSLTESSSSYYHCTTTCISSGLSAISQAVSVPFTATCYCTPTYQNYVSYGTPASNNAMNKVQVSGYSGSNLNDAFAPSSAGYLDRTLATSAINLAQGGQYQSTVFYVNTSSYYENQAWIDYNDDGTFAASEAVTTVFGLGNCAATTSQDTFLLNVSLAAPLGVHRMRVRNAWSNTTCYNSTAMAPCGASDASKTYIYGAAVDYRVNIVAPPACTGTPAAGAATAGTATACASTPFTLNLTGSSSSGISYQWQSSSDSSTWTNIAGATTASWSLTATANKYYHCVLTCSYSGISSISSAVYVPYTTVCYCVPTYAYYVSYGTPAYTNAMNRVVLTGYSGSNLNDPFAPAAAGYVDRSLTLGAINLAQGGSYQGTINYINTSGYYENQVWIDYNDDGTFATSEAATSVFGIGTCPTTTSQDTFRINIALSAPLGTHRMRVRNAWSNTTCYNSTAMNPCGSSDASKNYIYGGTADYVINIVTPPACTGTPTPGTAVSGTATACTGTAFALSLSGSSSSGIAYQWQESSDSVSWSDISGATTASYSLTESASTYYQCKLICSYSGLYAFSQAAYVPFTTVCYCIPAYAYYVSYGTPAYNNAMNKVAINGFSGSAINDPFAPSAAGYVDRTLTSTPLNLAQGGSYSGTLYYVNTSSYYENQIWIDYDDNGTFATSEAITGVVGLGSCATTTNQDTFSLNIALAAPVGTHRMRVRNAWSNTTCYNSTAMNPCGQNDASKSYIYGATVDYLVNIVSPPACTGAPTAGSATSGAATACSGSGVLLGLSGSSSSGIYYQWQYSADSVTWTNISGATTASYSVTPSATNYYHCLLTCTFSGITATSQAVYVPYTSVCYCTPTYNLYTAYGTPAYANAMNKVVINGVGGSTINDAFSPAAAGYSDRTLSVSAINLSQGGTYSGTLYYVNSTSYYEDQVWIDYNDDGTFAASEAVSAVVGLGSCSTTVNQDTFSLNVSISAPAGVHRMRVRNAWSNTSCLTSASMNPCGQSDAYKIYIYGSTVDYLVNIVTPPACTGTPTGGTAAASISTACPSAAIGLSLSGSSASGINYQWQISADNMIWSNMSGATTSVYSTTESASKYYRCMLTCSVSGLSAASSSVNVPYSSVCYCTPTYNYYTSYGTPAYNNAMNKVVIRGHGASAISDLFSPAAAGYSDRTASVGAITFIPDFALGSSCQT